MLLTIFLLSGCVSHYFLLPSSDVFWNQDERIFDRIKRRKLLDRAQASLAIALGLSDDEYAASVQFREKLNESTSLAERREILLAMLTAKKDEIPGAALLITKPDALNLLAEQHPRIRTPKDQVVHGYHEPERSWYEGPVLRSTGNDKVALTSILDYIFPELPAA